MRRFLRAAMFVAVLSPAGLLAAEVTIEAQIPREGDFLAFGFGSIWMMSEAKLIRVNPTDNSFIEIPIEGAVGKYRGIAVGEGGVWIPDTGTQKIFKIDPGTNRLALTIPAKVFGSEGSIGVGAGSIWAITGPGFQSKLTRFDAATGSEQAAIPMPRGCNGVIFDFDSVWITGSMTNELYRVDPGTNSIIATIAVHPEPGFLSSGEESVWVLNRGDGTVQRVDGRTGEVLATIDADARGRGGDIAVGGGFVWVTTPSVPVIAVDPRDNTLLGEFQRPGDTYMGDAIRYGAGSLWVSGKSIFRIKPPQ